MHFGLIPRSHRGIFCMNELPDLSPKIQVGLFNVLEERDIQIRGFTVRLPLDLCLVFSANPEDYTNRGRIVTPLKDRIGSVVRTHYPLSRELGIEITRENAWEDRGDEVCVVVPGFLRDLEETSRLARIRPHVNQASGVSVRMSIANLENTISNAERRALLHGEPVSVARISDLSHIAASSRGKMELAMTEDTGDEDYLVRRLIGEAVKAIFDEWFKPKQFRAIVEHIETGGSIQTGDGVSSQQLLDQLSAIPGLTDELKRVAESLDRAVDRRYSHGPARVRRRFILDGLQLHNRLNKRNRQTGTQATGL